MFNRHRFEADQLLLVSRSLWEVVEFQELAGPDLVLELDLELFLDVGHVLEGLPDLVTFEAHQVETVFITLSSFRVCVSSFYEMLQVASVEKRSQVFFPE